ncbi:MAG: ABC transporter permease [Gammaproteobacteria bacterium CG_4_10_14_0_8_um_filter_38_16]|nr:MAG: ABC transporter permease [Gammaproteobacteria bacterium CG_4_10_14_0_8_um_filter_38_16]PJA03468.1 MAG: ABC transporter permease [Gammaproteobacteria bacterium CG_4_10_14_0_2_um_filter_38_22]PJB10623.1 MAG: ABC transporter permease [Gammaproteobacteria bacterium CG_4_9_14_3_um_filter_38_9]
MTPKQILIAYQTIIIKELLRCFRIWPQTIMPPAITTILYFLIFGKLIGSQISAVQGFTYMQYIAPGLIMMQVITNSYINASSSFFSMKFQRSIEEILISPTPNLVILLGFITGSVARGFIVGCIVMLIALLFTHLNVAHVWLMLLTVLMTSIFFATAGVINGIFARNFDDVSWIPSFVLTPLTYLGGVFFSITMLSGIWQKIAMVNPILYIVDLFRYSVLDVADGNIFLATLILFAATFVLFFYALYLLKNSSRLRN